MYFTLKMERDANAHVWWDGYTAPYLVRCADRWTGGSDTTEPIDSPLKVSVKILVKTPSKQVSLLQKSNYI